MKVVALGFLVGATVIFLVALVIQLAVRRFHNMTALAFIRAITAPLVVKKLLVLTLSLIDTILHAVDRSRTRAAFMSAKVVAICAATFSWPVR